jgi:thioredoxin reductase (NADPH)
MTEDIKNLIIIGSGPAGLTAAIYAARANLKPIVICGMTYGGQLMSTSEVENFPGFPQGIQGPQLMRDMIAQAERFGAVMIYEDVTAIDFLQKPLKVQVGQKEYFGKSVIIATGAAAMWLGLPSETKLRGKGISGCATCDGFFFKNREVAVIGGGDSAMEEANYLTKFASKITVINRGENFKASEIMVSRARQNPKISFLMNKTTEEFLGEERLTGIKLKDTKTGELSELKVDGVFVAIGRKPSTDVFKGQVDMDAKGYINVQEHSKTNLDGVFVAGDVSDYRYRQAIVAAGAGCMAALDVEKYLEQNQE